MRVISRALLSVFFLTLSFTFMAQNISGVINIYQKVRHYDFCKNSLHVWSTTGFNVGDKVLLIQMKGASVDVTNTPSCGAILNYENAGHYEFGIVGSVTSNIIYLRDSVQRTYNESGFIQVIRVPQYTNATITDTLKCIAWNDSTGGILVFDVSGTLTMNAPIDVSNSGFKGGRKFNCSGVCTSTQIDYIRGSVGVFIKGESIAYLPLSQAGGIGNNACGGGGGGGQAVSAGLTDAWYMGGGGGGNFANGGRGGKSSTFCSVHWEGGIGGRPLEWSASQNRIFLAGGGGAGHHRYSTTGPDYGTSGGGTAIIKASTIVGNNQSILANAIDVPFIYSNVGRSGGGAGGSVLLQVQNFSGNININLNGGKGGNNSGSNSVGPGGGGSGGVVWVSLPSVPSNLNITANGGVNGTHTSAGAWGATSGQPGGTATGLSLTQTNNAVFVPVSTTTSIITNSPLCEGDTLILTTGPVPPSVQYNWTGPNGFNSNLQSPQIDSATTLESGVYTLEVLVQGCPGPVSDEEVFIGAYPPAPAVIGDTICWGTPNPTFVVNANDVKWYADSALTQLLSTDSTYKPTITSVGTHIFYVTQNDSICVSEAAQVILEILSAPAAPVVSDQIVCFGTQVQPFVITSNGVVNWYSDSLLTNLVYTGDSFVSPLTTAGIYNYYVNVLDTGTFCTTNTSEVTLSIVPIAYAIASNDTNICKYDTAYLNVGASFYSTFLWSTGATTQQIAVAPNVPFSTYYVTVNNGCGTAVDSVKVNIVPLAPVTTNDTVCSGSTNPALTSTGTNVKWYADALLTTFLAQGTSFVSPATAPGSYTYYATQTTGACESFPTPCTLVILPTPAQPAVSNQTICLGDPIVPFVTTSPGIITWYADSLLNTVLVVNDTFVSPETTEGQYFYYVTVLDTVSGCVSLTKEVFLMIIPPPYAIASNDTTLCRGEIAYISCDASINSSFLWSNGATTQQLSVSPTVDTEYFVTVNNGCFGVAVDSVTVFVWPLPPANAGADTSVCLGGTATLTASGGLQYAWSNALGNVPTVTTTPSATTTYVVTVTDGNGCSESDNVVVNVMPLPVVSISGDTLICEGNSTVLSATGGVSFIWSTSQNTASIVVSPVSNTTYTVTVTDNNTCVNTQSFPLIVQNTFYAEITSDFAPMHEITQGQLVTFTASPPTFDLYKFFINNEQKQSAQVSIFKTASLNDKDFVSVIAYQFGCPSVEDSLRITVKPLPSAITPLDKDGINDVFAKGLELTIINRWGQELFKGISGWDGTYKNKDVAPGTYYYVIELNKGTSNATILTGSLNVVEK